MAVAEEEVKEDGVVEVRTLISFEIDRVLLHVEKQGNDGTQMHSADLVSTLTASTTSEVSFIKLCLISEKLQVFPSTSEEVSVLLPAQLLSQPLKPKFKYSENVSWSNLEPLSFK